MSHFSGTLNDAHWNGQHVELLFVVEQVRRQDPPGRGWIVRYSDRYTGKPFGVVVPPVEYTPKPGDLILITADLGRIVSWSINGCPPLPWW